jgi:hypothetical protein
MLTDYSSVVVSKGSSNIDGKWFDFLCVLRRVWLTPVQAMVDARGGDVYLPT